MMQRSSPPLPERLEALLAVGRWPVRIVRALGIRPKLVVRQHRVPVTGVLPGRSLRIGLASDFHAGPTTDPEVFQQCGAALTAARPDLILLGGDFVGLEAGHIEELLPMLAELDAPLGRFAVLGNHDHWAGPEHVQRKLEETGIPVLRNRSVRLPRPFENVFVCGVDDAWAGAPDAAAALAGADGLRVVLMHSPSSMLDLGNARFDLALCGHTHGGQIALPGGVPIYVPHGALSRRYCRGRFDLDGQGTLIVSVGVGCGIVPVRTFTPPEVIICDLVSE